MKDQEHLNELEATLEACRQVVNDLAESAVYNAMAEELDAIPTVRAVVLTKPLTPFCSLGFKDWRVQPSKGRMRTGYARCKGAKCPHCVFWWMEQRLREAFTYLGTGTVYRGVLTDTEARNRSPIRKALAQGENFWIRQGDSERVYFSSVPFSGSEPVSFPPGVLEALLSAPRTGRRVVGLPKLEHVIERDSDEAWGRLPSAVSPRDLFDEVQQRLGRRLEPKEELNARGGSFAKRLSVSDLTRDEANVAIEVARPHDARAKEEMQEQFARLRGRRDTRREGRDLLTLLGLPVT